MVKNALQCCPAQAVSKIATDSADLASVFFAVSVACVVVGNYICILLFEKTSLVEFLHAVADVAKTKKPHGA